MPSPSEMEALTAGWRRRAEEQAAAAERQRRSDIERLRPHAQMLAERFGVTRVVLFGSRARGSSRPGSDVDLAVEGLPDSRYIEALRALETELGPEAVDLVQAEQAGASLRAKIDAGIVLHG